MTATGSGKTTFVDESVFRDAISRFATGVTVITTHSDGKDHGTTASAVSSLSLDPPMLLICLNRSSVTQTAIREAGFFAVNVLADEQADLAYQFAKKGDDKFSGVEILRGQTGAPLLAKALTHFECRVTELASGGTHTVFLAEVQNAVAREGEPLTYFRGKFGRLENALQEGAYVKLRELVLDRDLPLGKPLDVDMLTGLLSATTPQVYYALTKLSSERLIARDADGSYVVKPLDVETACAALDARAAVELSLVDQIVANATDAELASFYEAANRVAESIRVDGTASDLETFLRAAREFHERFVGFSGNNFLIDFHQRIGVHAIWFRALAGISWGTEIDSARFLGVADALQRRDAPLAKETISRVAEQLKEMATATISAAGGSL